MIKISFDGLNPDNVIRQILAFAERIDVKEAPKRGRHEAKKKYAPGSCESDLGEGKYQQVSGNDQDSDG